jgi:hypothetical protein
MDPQEGGGLFPFSQCITFKEPRGSSSVMRFPKEVVIRRWVGRGMPMLGIPLQLITCKVLSISATKGKI